VLARVLEPLPLPVRTLDAIHLASADFLRGQGQEVTVATYDARMAEAARAMGFELYPLE
jgi:predicted nucleic acid-binding protein